MESPHEISARNREMAQEYRSHAIEFSKLKRNRAIEWLEFRKTAKSNAEADRRLRGPSFGWNVYKKSTQ
jgi:hypothetical protein